MGCLSNRNFDCQTEGVASTDGLASLFRRQAAAGFFMAGPGRSAWYVWEKVKKKWAAPKPQPS